MAGPWKKNLLEALSREHRCKSPTRVHPPFGHQCAVCGKTVEKGHPLHRADRPFRSEAVTVSVPRNGGVDTPRERCYKKLTFLFESFKSEASPTERFPRGYPICPKHVEGGPDVRTKQRAAAR